MRPIISLVAAAFALTSCVTGRQASEVVECHASPPARATRFETQRAIELAGLYTLTVVATSRRERAVTEVGELQLWVPDSVPRFNIPQPLYIVDSVVDQGRLRIQLGHAVFDSIVRWHRSFERPLFGSSSLALSPFGVQGAVPLASTDPTRPGVVFDRDELLLGSQPRYFGMKSADGPGDLALRIEWSSPSAFGGSWRARFGLNLADSAGRALPPARGYFCATRKVRGEGAT